MLGDASEPSLLERAGVRVMDVVVAATGDDEDNLVVANLAKIEFGVPRVVGRVKNAANAWLYQPEMGVDVQVSAPHTIAQLIEEQVVVGDVVQLLELAEGQAALLEVTLPQDSPVAGRAVSEVEWPADCVPAAVIRDSQVLPAPGGTVLRAGRSAALHLPDRGHRVAAPAARHAGRGLRLAAATRCPAAAASEAAGRRPGRLRWRAPARWS